MTDAGKMLTAAMMLGAAWEEMHKPIERTCQTCRLCIEHNGLLRCARSGKITTLDESCPYWEVRIDD